MSLSALTVLSLQGIWSRRDERLHGGPSRGLLPQHLCRHPRRFHRLNEEVVSLNRYLVAPHMADRQPWCLSAILWTSIQRKRTQTFSVVVQQVGTLISQCLGSSLTEDQAPGLVQHRCKQYCQHSAKRCHRGVILSPDRRRQQVPILPSRSSARRMRDDRGVVIAATLYFFLHPEISFWPCQGVGDTPNRANPALPGLLWCR